MNTQGSGNSPEKLTKKKELLKQFLEIYSINDTLWGKKKKSQNRSVLQSPIKVLLSLCELVNIFARSFTPSCNQHDTYLASNFIANH